MKVIEIRLTYYCWGNEVIKDILVNVKWQKHFIINIISFMLKNLIQKSSKTLF